MKRAESTFGATSATATAGSKWRKSMRKIEVDIGDILYAVWMADDDDVLALLADTVGEIGDEEIQEFASHFDEEELSADVAECLNDWKDKYFE
jgi:hypothetical protein